MLTPRKLQIPSKTFIVKKYIYMYVHIFMLYFQHYLIVITMKQSFYIEQWLFNSKNTVAKCTKSRNRCTILNYLRYSFASTFNIKDAQFYNPTFETRRSFVPMYTARSSYISS